MLFNESFTKRCNEYIELALAFGKENKRVLVVLTFGSYRLEWKEINAWAVFWRIKVLLGGSGCGKRRPIFRNHEDKQIHKL